MKNQDSCPSQPEYSLYHHSRTKLSARQQWQREQPLKPAFPKEEEPTMTPLPPPRPIRAVRFVENKGRGYSFRIVVKEEEASSTLPNPNNTPLPLLLAALLFISRVLSTMPEI